MPVRCQNVFGKLESQSTRGLPGEEKVVIYMQGGLHLLVDCLFKEMQNFLLEMLWFRSSHFTKVIPRVHSLHLSPSLLDQAEGGLQTIISHHGSRCGSFCPRGPVPLAAAKMGLPSCAGHAS